MNLNGRLSFNEFAGIPLSSATTSYYYPWYDMTNGNLAAPIVANPSSSQTANVTIKIAGATMGNYTIPAGGRITPTYPGVINGPLTVTSDVPVVTTQRVHMNLNGRLSFNEFAGI
jgi:hypothetical protein